MTFPGSEKDLRALVDTAAYFGLLDPRQIGFAALNTVLAQFISEQWRLFTTNFIVAETHALILSRLGYSVALAFLRNLDESPTTVVRVSEADEQRARLIIARYLDKRFSYTDATSFAVMERLGIRNAFTLDRNFAQFGLTAMPGQ